MSVCDGHACSEYMDKVNKYGREFVLLTEKLVQKHKNPNVALRKLKTDKQFLNDFINEHYHHFEKMFTQIINDNEVLEDETETEIFMNYPKKISTQKTKKLSVNYTFSVPRRQYSLVSYDHNSGCLVERKRPGYTPYYNPPLRSAKNRLEFNELLDIVDHIRELQKTIDLLQSRDK